MSDSSRNKRNRKKSDIGGPIVIAIIFLANILSSISDEYVRFGVLIFPVLIIGVLAYSWVKKKLASSGKKNLKEFITQYINRGSNDTLSFGKSRYGDHIEKVPLTSTAPAVIMFDEYAQDKNFIRDRDRRMRQLDGFLQNGIIEKEEYLILKARYMKDYR